MDRSQYILLGGAALILAYQIIKGWSLGIVRQLGRLAAIAAAYASGFLWGKSTVPFLRSLGYPDVVLQSLGGFLIGLVVFIAISTFSKILFKRTADQEFGLTWFFYGISGALMGAGFGLFIIFLVGNGIRITGALAEGVTHQAPPLTAKHSPGRAILLPPPVAPAPPTSTNPAPTAPRKRLVSPVLTELVGLKHSLEACRVGETLQMFDPVPKGIYEITRKMGQITTQPEACVRFLSYPGAKELIALPEIVALRDDPDIQRSIAAGSYGDLLTNKHLLKVANDPRIAAMLGKFDFEKALDYALEK